MSDGLQSPSVEVQSSQVDEDVLRVEAVDLRGCNQVCEDDLMGVGIGDFSAVVYGQRLNAGDAGVDEGEREQEHVGYVVTGADVASASVKWGLGSQAKLSQEGVRCQSVCKGQPMGLSGLGWAK